MRSNGSNVLLIRTRNSPIAYEFSIHAPLSMMLNRQYEEIANHYERVFAQIPPQGRFQPSCNAPRAKIKECTETIETLQLLHHVSTCASDPCRGKYCPLGLQECDRLNALGHHIRGCQDPQCTFPECQKWNVAMKTHWKDVESEKCRDSGCLMCALNRPTTLDTGERNRIGGNSFHTCRGGIRSQLLRIYNEKRKINQEQAGGSRRIKEHTSKCRSCLMHAIQLMPAENAHKTFLWSLDGYAGKTSNNNCDILKSMIQNIINHRGEILALWNNGQEDDVWDTVTSLMVFGG
ncbi:hypothetical protein PSENEW3_00000238 [Picochlorum sp. SENEW3]|nr:hypothetical protein PSENEW3_00000238 [Picochlorum sp. SENEW3]